MNGSLGFKLGGLRGGNVETFMVMKFDVLVVYGEVGWLSGSLREN